jgi:hypothetical protein
MNNDEKYIFLFINDTAPKIPNKFAALCDRKYTVTAYLIEFEYVSYFSQGRRDMGFIEAAASLIKLGG